MACSPLALFQSTINKTRRSNPPNRLGHPQVHQCDLLQKHRRHPVRPLDLRSSARQPVGRPPLSARRVSPANTGPPAPSPRQRAAGRLLPALLGLGVAQPAAADHSAPGRSAGESVLGRGGVVPLLEVPAGHWAVCGQRAGWREQRAGEGRGLAVEENSADSPRRARKSDAAEGAMTPC